MENTRKNRLVLPIVALSVIAVLAITTIVMALVKVDCAPNLAKPTMIEVVGNTSDDQTYTSDSEVYTNMMNNLEDSFKESSLSALFNGRLFGSAEAKAATKKVDTSKINGIMLYYTTDQKIVINNETITYKYVYIELNKNESRREVSLYLTNTENSETSYSIATYADFTNLVTYLN